ncbi:hypothetical protein [Clostridium perfringens]|uniref:hypothetical protein n=1 Tax=Clostridium perfringens TaxID=1502 RepID=UPI002FCCE040
MLRSNTYIMLKDQITDGRYENEDMLYRLDVFHARGRLTSEQYAELVDMVNDNVGK